MKARRGATAGNGMDPLKVESEVYDTYDYATFTVANSTTNYDVKTNNSTLFKNAPNARGVMIWSDKDITVRFNNTDLPAISHEAVYSPHQWFDKLQVTNIFVTNTSGDDAALRIFLV